MRQTRILLVVILLAYLVLGTIFAVYTPAWQAPDEPAHYNYIRYLAEHGSVPVLQMGDYPTAYLEQIKGLHFPANMSIDTIRYESHQPPLYYALAVPVYLLAGGALLPLRLFSVLLGAGIVLLAYLVVRRIYPARPVLALGTAAFVAFVPQHLATVAQVGNDVLAELLLASVLFVLVGWAMQGRLLSPATLILSGILLGLVLDTKTTAYIALPLAGGVLIWLWVRTRASARRVVLDLVLLAIPVLVLALPWYLRNLSIYGWPDFLGLARHDAVVVGQMRTSEFLAQNGWRNYMTRAVSFTFKSFWGVFGWLGVFLDDRVYTTLTALTGLVTVGLVLRLPGVGRPDASRPDRHAASGDSRAAPALWLLATTAVFAVLVYIWYNLQFVQHQGRYLFTALIPAGLAFTLGWEQVLRLERSRLVAAVLAFAIVLFAAWRVIGHQGLPKWPLALTLPFVAGLVIRPWLPRRLDALIFALPYLALPLLAVYCVFAAIVPQLAR